MLDFRVPLLASPPVWNNLMNVVDDPRIGLVILIGSMLLCTFLWFGRRPHVGWLGVSPIVEGWTPSSRPESSAFLRASRTPPRRRFAFSLRSALVSEAVQSRHASR